MWKREDYTGTKEVVWYSEEEYKGIEKELAKFEEILYNGFKAYTERKEEDFENFADGLEEVGLWMKFVKREEGEK